VRTTVVTIVLILWAAAGAWGLDRTEILVVYNENFPGSKTLAEYYVARRRIPREQVLGVKTSRGEHISRREYLETIQTPVRAWVEANKQYDKIKCVLLMRGVPLTVDRIPDEDTWKAVDDAARAMRPFQSDRKKLETDKKRLEDEAAADRAKAVVNGRQIRTLETKIAAIDETLKTLKEKYDVAEKAWDDVTKNTNASVDSELALMFWDGAVLDRDALKLGRLRLVRSDDKTVQTQMWVRNLLNHNTWRLPGRKEMPRTFMACRLDGPTDALVRRMIDDSIAVENAGLEGVAYFDARGMRIPPTGKMSFYAVYDELIRRGAEMVEKTGMKTVVDDGDAPFPANTCPNAALYCGWYHLAHYVPAFKWQRGSVGYHVASAEATTLRNHDSEVWCKRMIEEGVAATLGPVSEPYLQTFPDPSPFFAFLLTGRYTVAEAFWYSSPVNSWMQTLVADPLYTPFRKNPKMTVAQMKDALKPRPLRPLLPGQDEPDATPEE